MPCNSLEEMSPFGGKLCHGTSMSMSSQIFFIIIFKSYWPAMLMVGEYRSSSNGSIRNEKTLAMIKPDGLFGNYTDRIKNVILESGFIIFKEKVVQLDEDSAASFYAEHSTRSFFSSLVKYMTRYLLCFCDLSHATFN